MNGKSPSTIASTLNEIQDNLIYCEIDQDITHLRINSNRECYVILKDRLSSKQSLVHINGTTETTIQLDLASPVKSLFGLDEDDSVFILLENGTLLLFDKAKTQSLKSKLLARGDYDEKGFAVLKFKQYPEEAKIIEASVVNTTMHAKIAYYEAKQQKMKYSFELAGLKTELTPDESSIQRVLNGIEASEDSKISCIEPSKGWLLICDLHREKSTLLMNVAIEMRSHFENER